MMSNDDRGSRFYSLDFRALPREESAFNVGNVLFEFPLPPVAPAARPLHLSGVTFPVETRHCSGLRNRFSLL
jgi:hypothetical protein